MHPHPPPHFLIPSLAVGTTNHNLVGRAITWKDNELAIEQLNGPWWIGGGCWLLEQKVQAG